MKRKSIHLLLVVAFLAVIMTAGHILADINETAGYQGNKARITVGKIKDKAQGCSWEIAAAVGEMLSTALTNSGRFIVLASKEEVDELIEEIDLGQSDYVEEGRGPEKGLMEGADILVSGAITGFEPDAGGSGGALGGLKKKAFGGIGAGKKNAVILMDIKLIDIRTRRIIKALSLEGKATKWKIGGLGGGAVKDVVLVGALGAYSNEPMEKAVRDLIGKSVEKLGKEIPDDYFRYQGGGQYTTEYGSSAAAQPAAGQPAASATSVTGGGSAAAAPAKPAVAPDMQLYSKYDFVPGDKVIFYDDLKNEEEGEFPYRWNFINGVFEIARMGGKNWIWCSDPGDISPKIPEGPLPANFTIEMEFYDKGGDFSGHYFYLYLTDGGKKVISELGIVGCNDTWVTLLGKSVAGKNIDDLPTGVHTMRYMVSERYIKCFINEVRVANIPRPDGFNPAGIKVKLRKNGSVENNPVLMGSFRYAESSPSLSDQLAANGKIITHGILFDPDSYIIKGGSFRTLKNIGGLLEDEPALRLSIEGHTDSDGTDEHNKTLSENRAKAVRDYMISTYGIGADRLEFKGWGEGSPIDANNSPEGKANNRRVELVKL